MNVTVEKPCYYVDVEVIHFYAAIERVPIPVNPVTGRLYDEVTGNTLFDDLTGEALTW